MEKLTNRLFKLPDLEQVDEPIIFESYDSIKGIILDSIRSIEIEYKNKLEDNYIRTEIGELEFCKGRLYVLTARHSYHTFCLSLNLIKDLAVDKKKPVQEENQTIRFVKYQIQFSNFTRVLILTFTSA